MKLFNSQKYVLLFMGGCDRFRTCDPCLAKALLYQLSYAPEDTKVKTQQQKPC